MDVLVIGSGGREHALVWKLRQSSNVKRLFVAPGNAGTRHIACNIGIETTDIKGLLRFAKEEKIDLTIVGSEELLALGIADAFIKKELKIFAPSEHDAQIESSKIFGKFLMKKAGIPTAPFEVFSNHQDAVKHLNSRDFPLVIKADGLAKGKGVRVCSNISEAIPFLEDIMVNKLCGEAGRAVVIEDCLKGIEYSAHALVSGEVIVPFPMSQDYKSFRDRNTGGMGAIAPVLTESKEFLGKLTDRVINPAIDYMAKLQSHSAKYNFVGCIYPGIIVTPTGLYVLEYNVRFGDPEASVYMRLLKSDLAEALLACAENRLSEIELEWHDGYAVCVVLVSDGYPGRYNTGFPITGIQEAEKTPGVVVFHAGTDQDLHGHVTAGGRVLNVTATGNTLEEARTRAYEAVDCIHFEGKRYRDDIGLI